MLKGRRVLRSTAPENSLKTPENSPITKFSTLWKKFFHCVEVFHTVENLRRDMIQIYKICLLNHPAPLPKGKAQSSNTNQRGRCRFGYHAGCPSGDADARG